jgi:ABC-type Fe3+/spermidine/putrescine transport system ATPase subunit
VSIGETVLRLAGVSKLFGLAPAVDRVSLEIQRGEIFTLLGPSGCGKTTTLRLVAGLERPDAGEIVLRGRVVASAARRLFVAPHKRNLGMVFQSYAIWPHMTVFENVAYPLRLRGTTGAVVRDKVVRVLDLVGLSGLEERSATLLSGGQMQRLALCRSLVYEPDLLLLDEPFSNLDAKLREQMRVELKLLQRRLGVTVLFVTHDQIEALSLSDRIAVMQRGRVEQVGTPRDLYERPGSPFVRLPGTDGDPARPGGRRRAGGRDGEAGRRARRAPGRWPRRARCNARARGRGARSAPAGGHRGDARGRRAAR